MGSGHWSSLSDWYLPVDLGQPVEQHILVRSGQSGGGWIGSGHSSSLSDWYLPRAASRTAHLG